jgi:hypothetical protein
MDRTTAAGAGAQGRPRVVLASRRLVEERVWHAAQLELEDVVAEVDDVAWCLPRPLPPGAGPRLARGVLNRAGRPLGRERRGLMRSPLPTGPPADADLFFMVCADANGIGVLPHVAAHARAAQRRVAWIVELWSAQLPQVADYVRQLRGFDHVIVSNRSVADAVTAMTGVPCTYLPMAVDAERYVPLAPDGPARTVDVASWGRRLPGTHAPRVRALADGRLFYHFDTISGLDVSDHVEHRLVQAALLQRTRYSVVYRINDEPGRIERTGGEESLTNRYFEALAAGTIMLGTAPDTEEWSDAFPWPDAVVPIPAPAPDVLDVIEELDRDPVRLDKARTSAASSFLHRHDWAHRWRDVLALVGMDAGPQLGERLARLEARARAWDHPAQP